MSDSYNGFQLFSDIEDAELRTRNRAVVLGNIYVDNAKDGKLSPQGAGCLLNYFKRIPDAEKAVVQAAFVKQMEALGFKL